MFDNFMLDKKKKIILGVVGAIILICGGLIIYISNLDWNGHKNNLAANISRLIGEKVEFTGNLSVSLFPSPHLYAENVQILNSKTSEKLADIKSISTSVSLMSVLKKMPDIKTLEIEQMEIWVVIQEDGNTNWHQDSRPDFMGNGGGLQSFSLHNSIVHLKDEKHKLNFDLQNMTADIQAYSLQGPYRLDGNFTMDDEPFAMSIGLGNVSENDDISLSLNITHSKSKSFLRYDGTWNMNSNVLKGIISGSSEKTASFINILAHKTVLDEKYNVPLNFSGNIDRTENHLNLDTLVIKFDNLLNGSGSIRIPFKADKEGGKPEATVKYQMIDLDVRPVINLIKNHLQEYQAGKSYEPDTDMNVTFDLSAVHLIVSDETGGYFESTSAKGTWKDNALTLEEFFAACPGNITLQVDGSLTEENKKPHYYAKISIDGQNFLSWLNAIGLKITAPVQSSYRNPRLNLIATGDTQSVKLENISLSMDKMNLKSEINIFFNDNMYQVDMSADKINLDNYVMPFDAENGETWQKRLIQQLQQLNDKTLQLNMRADTIIFKGIAADEFILNALMTKDTLNLQELQLEDLLETDLKLSGNFNNLSTENISFTDVDAQIASQDILALSDRLEIDLPKLDLYNQRKINFKGNFSGQADEFKLSSEFSAADADINYDGKILNYASEEPTRFEGSVSVKALDFTKFLKAVGIKADNMQNLNGVFNGKADIAGTKKEMSFDELQMVLRKATYTGSGKFAKQKNKYSLQGNLTVNEWNIENFMRVDSMAAPMKNLRENAEFLARPVFDQDIIDYSIYNDLVLDIQLSADKAFYKDSKFEKVQLHLINDNKLLQLNDLAFAYDGAIIKGYLRINYLNEPQANGKLDFDNIMLSSYGGSIYRLDMSNLQASIDFSAPAEGFAQAVYGLNGQIDLNGRNLRLQGINLDAIAADLKTREYSKGIFQAIRDNLQSGETEFAGFSGKMRVKDGDYGFSNIVLSNDKEDVEISGNIVPEEWKMKVDFGVKYKELQHIPPYSFSFSGPVNKPILDINIGDIAKKYDSHWEAVEKEEENRKAAAQQFLIDRMTAVQEEVSAVEQRIHQIYPKIEKYRDKSDIQANINQYNNKLKQLDDMMRQVESMKSTGRQSNFTEQDIQAIERKCPEFMDQLNGVTYSMEEIYKQDLQQRMDHSLEEANQINADSRQLFDDYQKMIQDDFNELLKIDASQYMINNTELKSYQAKMVNLSDKMADKLEEFKARYDTSKMLYESNDAEMAITDLKQSSKELQQIMDEMQDVHKKTANILLNMINERQKVYQQEQEKKALKKAKQKASPTEGEEVESSAENDDSAETATETQEPMITEPVNETPAETTVPEAETPEQISETAPTEVNVIRTKYDTQPANQTPAATSGKRPLLVEITDENEPSNKKVSGSITKSYEEVAEPLQNQSTGLLKESGGYNQKVSGKITVK